MKHTGGIDMAIEKRYQPDVEAILAKRHDNGADYWATPDKRLLKGSVFSTLESTLILLELGMEPSDPLFSEIAGLIFSTWREDGRFKLYPDGGIYPCHTIGAANVLCHLGYSADKRLKKTFEHLFAIQFGDGGWRCNKFFFGRGPETEFSNPGPTLTALNMFRFTDFLNKEPALNNAVTFLLNHWTTRMPLGPCHYGIGTLFMQVEYPFATYNLFAYVYVLSFYNIAKKDARFLEALSVLESKLQDGMVLVERVNKKLAGFSFCEKGKPSELATRRYYEILKNLSKQ
jgi:hypothetical protein